MELYPRRDQFANESKEGTSFTSDNTYNAGYKDSDFLLFENSPDLENISSPENLDLYNADPNTTNHQKWSEPSSVHEYKERDLSQQNNAYGYDINNTEFCNNYSEYQTNGFQNDLETKPIQRVQSKYINQSWNPQPNNNYKCPTSDDQQTSWSTNNGFTSSDMYPNISWSNSDTLSTVQASQIKANPKTFAEFQQHVVRQRNIRLDNRTIQIINEIRASTLNSRQLQHVRSDISQQIDPKQFKRLTELRRQLKKQARMEKKEQMLEQRRIRIERRQERIKMKEIKKERKLRRRREKFQDVYEVSNLLAKVSSDNNEDKEMTPAQKFLEMRRQLRKAEQL